MRRVSKRSLNMLMDEICTENLKPEHLASIQCVTKTFRDEHFRCSVETGVLQSLSLVLLRLSSEVQLLNKEDHEAQSAILCLQLTAECFRALRNACVECPRNQFFLRDQDSIRISLGIVGKLLKLKTSTSNHISSALCCGIQFLGNIAVGNQLSKDDIWEHGFPHIFLDLLELTDEKAVDYTCMVLHTCLDNDNMEKIRRDPCHIKVALKIIELCRTLPNIDWTMLIVTQHFFKSYELTEVIYTELKDQERLTFLELISAQLGDSKEESVIPLKTAQFLASCFQQSSKAVLSLSSASSADDQVLAVIRLLQILCDMTSDQRKFMALQDHPNLLHTTVAWERITSTYGVVCMNPRPLFAENQRLVSKNAQLLKEVHLLGKAYKNVFSTAQDFSFKVPEETVTHPALSFKAHLIRLIGNLCYGHTANQDQVRELDGIALILDNCSIDSNNPYISQWAVFAIRNILEHNVENQKQVQGLRRQGVADDSVLREMGFCTVERDGNLFLRPLKKEKEQREH